MLKLAQLPKNLKDSFIALAEHRLGVKKADGHIKFASNQHGVTIRIDETKIPVKKDEKDPEAARAKILLEFKSAHMYEWMLSICAYTAKMPILIKNLNLELAKVKKDFTATTNDYEKILAQYYQVLSELVEAKKENEDKVGSIQSLEVILNSNKAESELNAYKLERLAKHVSAWSGKRGKGIKAILALEEVPTKKVTEDVGV